MTSDKGIFRWIRQHFPNCANSALLEMHQMCPARGASGLGLKIAGAAALAIIANQAAQANRQTHRGALRARIAPATIACQHIRPAFLDRAKLAVPGGSVTGLSATDAWHRAEPVMWHVQHLSLESLVKMDQFQKEPPLNLKGPLGHKRGGRKGPGT